MMSAGKSPVRSRKPYIASMTYLRRNWESVLDSVQRGDSFIVTYQDIQRAAIVPIQEYENFQRYRAEAKTRLWRLIQEMRKRTSVYDPAEVQAAIDEAVQATRRRT